MDNQADGIDINPRLVREALQAILEDERFSSAPQMSAFLSYVVDRTLAGESARIKAYSVAVDALGKPETFDAQGDPSVRVLAVRLRSTLQEYYARTDGHHVFIRMRPGTYVPRFEIAEGAELPLPGADGESDDASPVSAREPEESIAPGGSLPDSVHRIHGSKSPSRHPLLRCHGWSLPGQHVALLIPPLLIGALWLARGLLGN